MRHRRRGFTLLELLVVLGILALLLTLVVPKFTGRLSASKVPITKQQIANTVSALEQFKLDVGRYPTNDEGLKALIAAPGEIKNWNGSYLTKKVVPKDGWGNELQYRCPAKKDGEEFEVFSLGADNKEGGEKDNADLFSWQP